MTTAVDSARRFFVPSRPYPEGSVKAMPFLVDCTVCKPDRPCGNKRLCENGRRATATVIHDNGDDLKRWRGMVAQAGRTLFERPMSGPVQVVTMALLRRPQNHRGETGRLLAAGRARPRPTVKPDADKLVRAALDALTAVAWIDDAQVVDVRSLKAYTTGDEGMMLDIRPAARYDAQVVDLLAALGAEPGDDGDVWPIGAGGTQPMLGGIGT